jgi:hypothetical protein
MVTTADKAIYSVNASTGSVKQITTLPFLTTTANALCNDSSRGILYFIENGSAPTNTAIYGYNYRTNTHFTLIADFRTAPGSPLIANGMGTSGATANDGYIYMGSEGARSLSPGVASYNLSGVTYFPFSNRIYKLTLNAAGTAIINTSVFKDFYNDNGEISYASATGASGRYDSDWGDFVIVKDTLFERIARSNGAGYELLSRAYKLATPVASVFSTNTLFADDLVQTAEDGNSNLIFTGNTAGVTQTFVVANKTDGTYNTATAKSMSVNGIPFTSQIADATSSLRGEGTIGNTVWNDINTNGIKDGSELGIQNAPIELWEDLDNNGIIDIVTDKLSGTAITDATGHYSFIKILPGNYLVRTVMTTSVNYPAQSFSASYPLNQLANIGVAHVFSGDETTGIGTATNLLAKNFAAINFNDQATDFGFTGTFTVLANNDFNLNANFVNGSVIINWQLTPSGNELNYEIQRSSDGINFNAIENGNLLNLSNAINKTGIDNNLPSNIHLLFYRIKITTHTGSIKYSNIERVNINKVKNDAVLVFPNPAKDNATFLLPLKMANKLINVTITNSSGQIVKSFTTTSASAKITIDIKDLQRGMYFWKVVVGNAKNKYTQGKLQIL